jgi:putative ABC transport system ATP-binding protein
MIELRHISKTFNHGTGNETNALQDVNLRIEDSDFVVVLGANGSGKTSLLNALTGTLKVDVGQILIDETDVTFLNDYRRSRWIARIFQNPLIGTAPELSVLENFRLAALRTQSKKFVIGAGDKFKLHVKEKISMLNLGLEKKIEQPMGTLSGGQRQALTLLMAVMDNAKILLMDEPTAALDPRTSQLLLEIADKIIKEFNLTAILITHQVKDALKYGNRVILMREGKVGKDLRGEEKSKLELSTIFDWFE